MAQEIENLMAFNVFDQADRKTPCRFRSGLWQIDALENFLVHRYSTILFEIRYPKKPSRNEIKHLEDILKAIEFIERNALKLRGFQVINYLNSDLPKSLEEFAHSLRKNLPEDGAALGPAKIDNMIAMGIFSTITRVYTNKVLRREIKFLLEPRGKLNQKIDKKFGKGAFDLVKLPNISSNPNQRWEKTFMETLKRRAWEFVFESQNQIDLEINPVGADSYFEQRVEKFWDEYVCGID